MNYNLAHVSGYSRWFRFDETLDLFSKISMEPAERLILSSDGSLTRLLESLYFFPVEVEVKNHRIEPIENVIAEYLNVSPKQDAITRDIWLKKDGKRLVYAHSVFLSAGQSKDFLDKLIKGAEPLGRLLRSYNLLTLRDNWEIGVIQCREIADDLGVPSDTHMWARRYRLLANPVSGNGITAAIMEVFSPDVVRVRLDDNK
ncbi:MAG: chorismate lyase [Deltaproteobacteria bacterium]|nr:chorismate lyase [Deltaproteobacteria bacterium]